MSSGPGKSKGFSLIELVVFIVVIGLALSGVFLAFSTALQKSPGVNAETTALELAAARMNIIIGQRHINGFSATSDPCTAGSPPAMCAGTTGYTVTSSISPYTVNTDSNYKLIDVLVSGPQHANADLKTLVAGV